MLNRFYIYGRQNKMNCVRTFRHGCHGFFSHIIIQDMHFFVFACLTLSLSLIVILSAYMRIECLFARQEMILRCNIKGKTAKEAAIGCNVIQWRWLRRRQEQKKTSAGVEYNKWCKTKWERFVSKLPVMDLLVLFRSTSMLLIIWKARARARLCNVHVSSALYIYFQCCSVYISIRTIQYSFISIPPRVYLKLNFVQPQQQPHYSILGVCSRY